MPVCSVVSTHKQVKLFQSYKTHNLHTTDGTYLPSFTLQWAEFVFKDKKLWVYVRICIISHGFNEKYFYCLQSENVPVLRSALRSGAAVIGDGRFLTASEQRSQERSHSVAAAGERCAGFHPSPVQWHISDYADQEPTNSRNSCSR